MTLADDLRAAVNWLYGDEHDALCKRLLAHADAGEVMVTREQLERWAQSLHGCNRHGVMHGEIEALIANALRGDSNGK